MTVDLRQAEYEEWVTFVFDRAISSMSKPPTYWWMEYTFHADRRDGREHVLTSPAQDLKFVAEFCHDSALLLSRFSPLQVSQGLSWLAGTGSPMMQTHLWNPEVPEELVKDVISSSFDLYDKAIARRRDLDPEEWGWAFAWAPPYPAPKTPAQVDRINLVRELNLALARRMLFEGDSPLQWIACWNLAHTKRRTATLTRAITGGTRLDQSEEQPDPLASQLLVDWLATQPALHPVLRQYASQAAKGEATWLPPEMYAE